jgi:hypothetical protein
MASTSIRNAGFWLFVWAVSACASNQLQPKTISSAGTIGYAVPYPDALAAAADLFVAHEQQAHQLATALPSHAPVLKPADDPALYLRVIDEADADGRRESFVRARDNDRTVRAFWESERGPLGARVSAAVQKQQAEQPGGAQFDAQPTIQHTLRDGIDRPLDKRLRAESEAERLLERYRTRLTPATWQATQRVAAEIALASYLVNVALIEDAERLAQLNRERDDVAATLERGNQDEQAILASGAKGAEQKASRERLDRIDKSRRALDASGAKADAALRDYEQRLRSAGEEYDRARQAVERPATPAATTAAPAK